MSRLIKIPRQNPLRSEPVSSGYAGSLTILLSTCPWFYESINWVYEDSKMSNEYSFVFY